MYPTGYMNVPGWSAIHEANPHSNYIATWSRQTSANIHGAAAVGGAHKCALPIATIFGGGGEEDGGGGGG